MSNPIHCGVGYDGVGEQSMPVLDGSVTCKNGCSLHVPFIDHLIEVIRLKRCQRFQSKVIDDEQVNRGTLFDPPVPAVISPASMKIPEHAGCLGKQHLISHPASDMSQGLGNVAFANTHRSQQKDVLFVFDIGTVCQLFDLLDRDLRIKGEVKPFEGLVRV